jgi:hypothetical protein
MTGARIPPTLTTVKHNPIVTSGSGGEHFHPDFIALPLMMQ